MPPVYPVRANVELSEAEGPAQEIILKLPMSHYSVRYIEGQSVRLTELTLPLIARSFVTQENSRILTFGRAVRAGNRTDASLKEFHDGKKWSVSKKASKITYSMLHYRLTPIFNGANLAHPFLVFVTSSGLQKDGISLYR